MPLPKFLTWSGEVLIKASVLLKSFRFECLRLVRLFFTEAVKLAPEESGSPGVILAPHKRGNCNI